MAKSIGDAAAESALLRGYVQELKVRTSRVPVYVENLDNDTLNWMRTKAATDPASVDIVYPLNVGYVHIDASRNSYHCVIPALNEEQAAAVETIRKRTIYLAAKEEYPLSAEDRLAMFDRLLKKAIAVDRGKRWFGKDKDAVPVREEDLESIRYCTMRDVIGYGPIDPLIHDPYIEDIHNVGLESVHVVHKAFQFSLRTNVGFRSEAELTRFLISMSERIGRPVSPSRPIVDGTLPDGSRINIIYSHDVSRNGSSFTVRKFTARPPTALQLVRWGTFSMELVAYLWLCLESKLNIIISGETASGKTTSLNSLLPFIDRRAKIFSAEDTPEVLPPQETWQRTVSRDGRSEESNVDLYDLLRAGLRSRPDYVVIGEIRGEEGSVVFHAMQTGLPVMTTFHASNPAKLIQRLTSRPISIPMAFIDNVNVMIFQSAVMVEGKLLRRVVSVDEVVGYSPKKGGVLTKNVFFWDPNTDTLVFRGHYNSYILEDKIALERGYSDKTEIYRELRQRERFLRQLMDDQKIETDDMVDMLTGFYARNREGIGSKA
jgi:flagellar protein FlaI